MLLRLRRQSAIDCPTNNGQDPALGKLPIENSFRLLESDLLFAGRRFRNDPAHLDPFFRSDPLPGITHRRLVEYIAAREKEKMIRNRKPSKKPVARGTIRTS
jgi:hypothetical protein